MAIQNSRRGDQLHNLWLSSVPHFSVIDFVIFCIKNKEGLVVINAEKVYDMVDEDVIDVGTVNNIGRNLEQMNGWFHNKGTRKGLQLLSLSFRRLAMIVFLVIVTQRSNEKKLPKVAKVGGFCPKIVLLGFFWSHKKKIFLIVNYGTESVESGTCVRLSKKKG